MFGWFVRKRARYAFLDPWMAIAEGRDFHTGEVFQIKYWAVGCPKCHKAAKIGKLKQKLNAIPCKCMVCGYAFLMEPADTRKADESSPGADEQTNAEA